MCKRELITADLASLLFDHYSLGIGPGNEDGVCNPVREESAVGLKNRDK